MVMDSFEIMSFSVYSHCCSGEEERDARSSLDDRYPCDSRYMLDDNNYRMCSLVAPCKAGSSPNARLYMLVATTTLSNQLCGCGLLILYCIKGHGLASCACTCWEATAIWAG